MAAGIDLLMLAHKAGAMAAATQAVRRKIAPWTMATVIGTSIMSTYMNAFEFAQHATSQLQFYGGIVLGCAIPALVYARLVVGFYLWSMVPFGTEPLGGGLEREGVQARWQRA